MGERVESGSVKRAHDALNCKRASPVSSSAWDVRVTALVVSHMHSRFRKAMYRAFQHPGQVELESMSVSSGLEQLTVQPEVMQTALVVSHMYSQFEIAMYSACQHPGQGGFEIIEREQRFLGN